jgi:hypothetical protein
VTRDAEDPRPVLLVLVIAFGRGENGGRVVLVYVSARAAEGRESIQYEGRDSIQREGREGLLFRVLDKEEE